MLLGVSMLWDWSMLCVVLRLYMLPVLLLLGPGCVVTCDIRLRYIGSHPGDGLPWFTLVTRRTGGLARSRARKIVIAPEPRLAVHATSSLSMHAVRSPQHLFSVVSLAMAFGKKDRYSKYPTCQMRLDLFRRD